MFPFYISNTIFNTTSISFPAMKLAFCFSASFPSPTRPFLQSFQNRGMDLSLIRSQDFPTKRSQACLAFSEENPGSPAPVLSSSVQANNDCSTDEEGGLESAISGNNVTVEEWQAWGTTSEIPAMVKKAIDRLEPLEQEIEIKLEFAGHRGKLQGKGRNEEDKKQRSIYKELSDPEEKLQFFTARQVAYRLLGSRGYMCQNCWLPLVDCMCSKLIKQSLWRGIRFWLYMHPKDFLRKNNTGKLLWQVFGKEAACLCIFGIQEHEQTMWNTFKKAGRDKVWCLYPEGDYNVCSVDDLKIPEYIASSNAHDLMMDDHISMNFILVDGTWKNSRAMLSRLKEHAHVVWSDKGLPCLALAHSSMSVMHRLRPQPSRDRTCTAAAAIQLLYDLSSLQDLELKNLVQSAEALENSLDLLLNALSNRRKRHGKPIIRAQRWKDSK